jgi:hypothetical protein
MAFFPSRSVLDGVSFLCAAIAFPGTKNDRCQAFASFPLKSIGTKKMPRGVRWKKISAIISSLAAAGCKARQHREPAAIPMPESKSAPNQLPLGSSLYTKACNTSWDAFRTLRQIRVAKMRRDSMQLVSSTLMNLEHYAMTREPNNDLAL